jgi:hypothetical protein
MTAVGPTAAFRNVRLFGLDQMVSELVKTHEFGWTP